MTDRTPAQHTPGPWTIQTVLDEVDQIERQVIHVPMPHSVGKHIAHIATWGGSPDPEADANARLIAQAPAMLDALRDCVESLSRLPNVDGAYRVTVLSQARAILRAVDGAA